jgi:hypothetical protein
VCGAPPRLGVDGFFQTPGDNWQYSFFSREQSRVFGTSGTGRLEAREGDLSTTYVRWIQRGSSAAKKNISPIRYFGNFTYDKQSQEPRVNLP